jgi:hypothetical protein
VRSHRPTYEEVNDGRRSTRLFASEAIDYIGALPDGRCRGGCAASAKLASARGSARALSFRARPSEGHPAGEPAIAQKVHDLSHPRARQSFSAGNVCAGTDLAAVQLPLPFDGSQRRRRRATHSPRDGAAAGRGRLTRRSRVRRRPSRSAARYFGFGRELAQRHGPRGGEHGRNERPRDLLELCTKVSHDDLPSIDPVGCTLTGAAGYCRIIRQLTTKVLTRACSLSTTKANGR